LDPSQAIQLLAKQIIKQQTFFGWDYGDAIVFDGMWEAQDMYPQINATNSLDQVLDKYENTKGQVAYNVLNGVEMPYMEAVGDHYGLFPIAYLSRAEYYNKHHTVNYENTTDLKVTVLIADHFVLKFPYHLPDGTYSRSGGWSGEAGGDHTFVWADDSFMGSALLARLAALYKVPDYINYIAGQQVTFTDHLRDNKDGLYRHGYNDKDQKQSCCKWSRANGWLMMSHVEVLLGLKSHWATLPQYQTLITSFKAHAEASINVQSADGRWHQVLNETSTFLETSTTAMFLLSFIKGVQNGWLDAAVFNPVIEKAWSGLSLAIQSDGTVTGICEGTGIGTNVAFYQARGTGYSSSSPGLGSVLKAAVAMEKYLHP